MVLALDTLPRKLTAVLLAIAASVPLSGSLWSHYRTDVYSRQGTAESLQQAIALQPNNAELHDRLGRVLLYSSAGDATRARGELERAAALDPRKATYTFTWRWTWNWLETLRVPRGPSNARGAPSRAPRPSSGMKQISGGVASRTIARSHWRGSC